MIKWNNLTLVNVIVTSKTENKDRFDLVKLSNTILNSEYYPSQFAALKLCRTHPFAKALVYSSGCIVCVGSPTVEQAFDNIKWFEDQIIRVLGHHIVMGDKKVQNMVGSAALENPKIKVNLIEYHKELFEFVQYEPCNFPGCTFCLNMGDPNAKKGKGQKVFNLFSSGKIVMTGFKSEDEFKQFFKRFYRIVSRKADTKMFWIENN